MIVRQADGVLHLIPQPVHAALARRIMEHCEPLLKHPRRASILLAVQEHDNGWREADAAPMVDPATRRILDFVHVPPAVRQGAWPRGVTRLREDDPWAALLVAHHAVTVYDRFRKDPAWASFFPRMEGMRAELEAACGRPREDHEDDYAWLRLGDVISLAFCTASTTPLVAARWSVQFDGGTRVRVTPPVFTTDVPFTVTACEIGDVPYSSDTALRMAVRTAPSHALEGVVAAS
jgi:hypothetical protein